MEVSVVGMEVRVGFGWLRLLLGWVSLGEIVVLGFWVKWVPWNFL